MSILLAEMVHGYDVLYPVEYTQEVQDNLARFLIPMNEIRTSYGVPMIVDSGWRPSEINKEFGGAPSSKHLIGLAADIQDLDGKVWAWVLQNLGMMQQKFIYFEDKRWTPDWVHFQLGGPGSGHRIYIPNYDPAPAPNAWNGVYDKKFDGDLPV
jgi:hypothetical protein